MFVMFYIGIICNDRNLFYAPPLPPPQPPPKNSGYRKDTS